MDLPKGDDETKKSVPCSVRRKNNVAESSMRQKESLHLKYFQATSLTTKSLVADLVSMLSLTFWAAYNCKTLHSYCHKRLRWKSSRMKKFFTSAEMKSLKSNPVFEPYGPVLNFKLLKVTFGEFGGDIVKQIKALDRVTLMAIHSPPQLLSRQHLWTHIHKLFHQQVQLRNSVVEFSLGILENEFRKLAEETTILKERIHRTFTNLEEAKDTLVHVSWNAAVLTMDVEYCLRDERLAQAFANNKIAHNEMISEVQKQLSVCEINLLQDVRRECIVRETLRLIEQLYMTAVKRIDLLPILRDLNKFGNSKISDFDWDAYHVLCDLRKVRKDRLMAIGRSEVISYHSNFEISQIDVNNWLLSRHGTTLHVSKIYSLLKRSDTSDSVSVDQLFENEIPKCIIVMGPVASGKTCLCQYLFHQWRSGNSPIKFLNRTDFVVYLKAENSSHSFVPLLKRTFPRSLKNMQNDEVLSLFQQFKAVFFVIDTGIALTGSILKAIKELAGSLGKNRIMVTVRSEKAKLLNQTLQEAHFQPVTFSLEPLCNSSIKQYIHDSMLKSSNIDDFFRSTIRGDRFLSGRHRFHNKPASVTRRMYGSLSSGNNKGENSVENSCDIENLTCSLTEELLGKERGKDLFYPLPLSFLIFLWLENPHKLQEVLTLPDLFEGVLEISHSKLLLEISMKHATCKKNADREIMKKMQKLFTLAAKSIKDEKSTCSFGAPGDINDDLTGMCSEGFFPFLVCSSLRYPQRHVHHHHVVLHHCLHEFLMAQQIINSLQCRGWMKHFKGNNNIQQVFPIQSAENVGGKYLDISKFVCASLSRQNGSVSYADHVVQLFKASGINNTDYCSWRNLLVVGKWQMSLQKAVSRVLNARSSLKIPMSNLNENLAMFDLLECGIYKPKKITITTDIPQSAIDALSSISYADISILPSPGYSGISNERNQDDLLEALSSNGNVVELWGKIDVQGATSLRNMTRLHTLHVHLFNIKALRAFCRSITECVSLQDLHLHLDLPLCDMTKNVPSLECLTRPNVYLILLGITESSCTWVAKFVKQLNCHPEQIHLKQARLTSKQLQAIKKELWPISIHASS